MSSHYADLSLFHTLLGGSQLFGVLAKQVIERSVEEETLPMVDYEYLFRVFKMEQNAMEIIDERGKQLLNELKDTYQITEE